MPEKENVLASKPGAPCWKLAARLWALGVLLTLEYSAIVLMPHAKLSAPASLRLLIAFCAGLLLLSWRRLAAEPWERTPLQPRLVWLHGLLLAGSLAVLALFHVQETSHGATVVSGEYSHAPYVARVLWFVLIALLFLSATAIFFPLRRVLALRKTLVASVPVAACMALLAVYGTPMVYRFWFTVAGPNAAIRMTTLASVRFVLRLFTQHIVYDPGQAIVGTSTFQILIGPSCSGVEGMLLMLLLTGGWMVFAGRELRLKRSLWLMPLSVVVMWVLNVVRILCLIAIGAAGYPDVAVGGFHTNAGWIFFNLTAVCFVLLVQNAAWFRRSHARAEKAEFERNTAAPYLLPFLVIVAVSLFTGAASSSFEWLYPLRLAAAAVTLWIFRREYRGIDWRFSFWGPLAGIAVFVLWLAVAPRTVMHGAEAGTLDSIGVGLARLAPWQRHVWLAVRVLAAVVTVPIAEELAFRGYLARRLMKEDVESVPLRRLTLLAIVVSSVLFGLLHGSMWMAGIAAGLVFAVLARWRGRLGEAVAAHATANLLLAVWVLARGDYSLW